MDGDVLPRTLKARSRPTDTTLQRHVSFFDDNGDRGVDVAECARGLRALGLAVGVAEAAALAIVAPLSLQTRGSLLAMNVDIDKIQKGKHDGDTGILDKRGRFNARRFDKVFGARSTVDRNGDKAFTATELTKMIKREPRDARRLCGGDCGVAAVAGAGGRHHTPSRVASTVPALSVARIEVVLRRHALLQAGKRTRLDRTPRRFRAHAICRNQALGIMSVRYRTDSLRSCA